MKSDYRKKAFCFVAAWFFLFVSAQSGLAVNAGKPASPSDGKGQPSIHLSETTYDFGEALEGSEVSHDFIVKNTGPVALGIERVRVG
jgi:hypothetical protein